MRIVLVGVAINSTSLKIYRKNEDKKSFSLLQGFMRIGAGSRDDRKG
jgi:hypothetical protein